MLVLITNSELVFREWDYSEMRWKESDDSSDTFEG